MEKLDVSLLIVEQNPVDAEALQKMMALLVREFWVAASIHEALELITEKDPDIVLTDIEFSEHSGIDLIKKIRILKQDAHIIILSAYLNMENLVAAINFRVDGFIAKSGNINELTFAIERVSRRIVHKRERIQHEERMIEELELVKKSLSLAQIGSWSYQQGDDDFYFSPEVYKLLKIERSLETNNLNTLIANVEKDDKDRVSAYFHDITTGKEVNPEIIFSISSITESGVKICFKHRIEKIINKKKAFGMVSLVNP